MVMREMARRVRSYTCNEPSFRSIILTQGLNNNEYPEENTESTQDIARSSFLL
jgi:hypothetical protein